jgi:phage gp29-like protein
MRILDRFRRKPLTEQINLSAVPDNEIMIEAANRTGGRTGGLSKDMMKPATSLQKQDFQKWQLALQLATDTEEPDRDLLLELYDSMMLDGHLMGAIESRILHLQRSVSVMLSESGEEDLELIKLIQRPWFDEFIYEAMFSKFTGTRLVELFDLDLNLELTQTTIIPQTNFNAKKGIILKEKGDTDGWQYKDGSMANYYIQLGKDDDLGMFAQLAPLVLGKKLAIGSWLDYIEKFGVPTRWVTTDRMDSTRTDELASMMDAMQSNQWAILQGNEKMELGETKNTDAFKVFQEIINLYNSEISKRILGGTGTSDEKSHVGAANVHYELAKDRYESDKIFIKNLVNQHLIPKLPIISSLYSGLASLEYEYDDSENLTVNQTVENAVALAAFFDLDIEELSDKTGFTITGLKQNGTAPLPAPPKK